MSNNVKASKFTDFSRSTNDFFNREFPTNQIKLETRTSSKGLLISSGRTQTFTDDFKVTTIRDMATGSLSAEVKNTSNFVLLKDSIECKSVTSLNSNNQITQQVTLTNPAFEGLKVDVSGTLNNLTGSNKTKAVLEIAQPTFVTTTTFDLNRGTMVWTDLATRYSDFQIGGEVSYDVTSAKVDKYSVAVALDRPREKFVLQALTGFKSANATYFQRFNDQIDIACKANLSQKSPLGLEVGAKYYLNGGGFLKAKLDNAGRLGLAFATDLRTNVQLILGASVDATKLKENVHKFGIELTFCA